MFPSNPRKTLVAVALLASTAGAAQAATLLVTVKTDSYDGLCNLHCSLRDAVAVANQSGAANTILLPSGTLVLSRPASLDSNGVPVDDADPLVGDLDIVGELRIRGAGPAKSRIRGQFNDRLLEVHPGARLVLESLTLEEGRSAHDGGAVSNHGQLVLREVLARNNVASAPLGTPGTGRHGRGGAIANHGALTLLASRFQDNAAEGDSVAGKAPMGGALYNLGNLRVRDSLFLHNRVGDSADAGNGPALFSSGTAVIERSSFVGNQGHEFSTATITNQGGDLSLANVTMSGNLRAVTNGHGETASGPRSRANLTNVTVTANTYAAVVNEGELLIRNSIIAGNFAEAGIAEPANCINRGAHFSYQASGLLRNDEPSNCAAEHFVSFPETFTHVLRVPLTQDDATHWLHELHPGGAAVDAGSGDCIDHDQRGTPRPQDGNGDGVAVCDLGAHELLP